MKRLLAVLSVLILVAPSLADAATKYVTAGCTNNGNGTASTCAASVGAAGAWNTLNNRGTLNPGDIVCISGTFIEALVLRDNGTSSQRVTHRGDCPGLTPGKLNGNGTIANLITLRNASPYLLYNDVEGLEITGSTGVAVLHYAFAGQGYNRFRRNYIHDNDSGVEIHVPCVDVFEDNIVQNSNKHNISLLDMPSNNGCDILLQRNTISGASVSAADWHEVSIQNTFLYNIVLQDNSITHTQTDGKGVMIGAGAITVTIQGNTINGSGVTPYGVNAGSGTLVIVRGNKITGFTNACTQGYDLNPVNGPDQMFVIGNILTNCQAGFKSSGVLTQPFEVHNNTFINNVYGIDMTGHALIAYNNHFYNYTTSAMNLQSGVDGYTGDYNTSNIQTATLIYKGFGSPTGNYASWSAFATANSQDTHSFLASPSNFIDVANYCPVVGSPLRGAGLKWWTTPIGKDPRGRDILSVPTIGACQIATADDVSVRF